MGADGSLIFNTKMDTSGFDKGMKQLSSKMLDLKNKVKTTESQISSLQEELKNLSNTEVKTKISEQLDRDIAKSKEKLKSLYAEADKIGDSKKNDLVSMGFGTEHLDDILSQDKSWQKVQADIDKAEEALNRYEAELKRVRAVEAQIDPTSTAEYKAKEQKLAELTRQLEVYKAKLQETDAEEKKSKSKTQTLSKIFTKLRNSVTKVGKSLGGAFKKGVSNLIGRIGNKAKESASKMGGLTKAVSSIKRALSGLLLYKGLSAILSQAKEGVNNLVQVSPELNNSMSSLMSALTQLKNTFATAFAPILNIVLPILTSFINILSSAADKVAQFMAALTGNQTYVKATKVEQDYANSIADTTSATEENTEAVKNNEKSVAGYDELNVMEQDSSLSNSNNSENALTPNDMFTTANIAGSVGNFANQLRDLFDNEDFRGIGVLIGDKINNALSSINWDTIRSTAISWASNLAEFLNGAVASIDWNLVGTTIGNGLMTIFDFLYTFLNTFDFVTFGSGLANVFNGLFQSINWSTVGGTFGGMLQAVIATAFGFVTTFDWTNVGLSISNFINSFFAKINWAMAGQTISTGVIGAFSTITSALQNIDWQKVGNDIGQFFANIDWWGILTTAAQTIWEAIVGIVQMIAGVWEENPIAAIIMGIVAALGAFAIIMAIVNAVMMVNPITWIVLGIVALIAAIIACIAYWDEICAVIQSAWNWICELFGNIANWIWENVISPIIGFFATLWDNVCKIFQDIADFISSIWNGIWNVIKGFINTIIDGINSLWSGIYYAVKGIVDSIGGIAGAIGDVFGQDWHFSMPSEPPLIPKLATGTVVPANYGEFLAVLGDNKREAEVVSPISAMKQAMSEVLAEFGGAGNGDITLTVNLDGRKIYQSVVDYNNRQRKRTGKSALA